MIRTSPISLTRMARLGQIGSDNGCGARACWMVGCGSEISHSVARPGGAANPGSVAGPLEIRLFGPFEARVHGTPLPHVRSRTTQWLLALLVLRHGRDVERSWLAGTLWPDSTEAHAYGALRTTLNDLRRA